MKNFLLFICLCCIQNIVAQETLLKGNISESLTRGVVVGAKIALQSQDNKVLLTRSNLDGQYVFDLSLIHI